MTAAAPVPHPPRFGEPAPTFTVRSDVNPRFVFDTVAGRYVVLFFLPEDDAGRAGLLSLLQDNEALFDGNKAAGFVVTASEDAIPPLPPAGARVFCDEDGEIAALYGETSGSGGVWLLDPGLRVLGRFTPDAAGQVVAWLKGAPSVDQHAGVSGWAPALLVPRVFEPEFCRTLIDYYKSRGGEASGFMRQIGDRTVLVHDRLHKRREDVTIEDAQLAAAARARIVNRLVPEIHRAYQFKATRMERYLVARYDAADQGFFRAHRDNTTLGTAHRRFAVTLNLNAEDYDGGELRFPEFGRRTYKPPTGGAVVFSCSLLHEATPVTRGERFAFLPFLYDEAGAEIRERNASSLEGDGVAYRK